MAPSEHQIQRAFFDWARMHPVARRAFAVPNGGARHPATAARLKAEGVRKGVLDVFLPVPSGGAHGLWIEFKAARGAMTPEQAEEAAVLASDGFCVAVCWDAMDAIDVTQGYLRGELWEGVAVRKPARKARAVG